MNIIPVTQGSRDWLVARAAADGTASEAPAALGQSKYQTRSDLLKQKSTGVAPDVGGAKQALFDRGHDTEVGGRQMAEEIIGNDLYPVTAILEIEGLNLLASLDGATMMEDEITEHKLWSESLAADVRAGTLSPHYTIQMDQQLLVSGAKRCLFMTSDGTPEKMAWCWYESSPEKFAALIAGWKQFRSDLAAYVPEPMTVEPVGKAPETLPALHIEVTGMVTASNLDAFKSNALAVFAAINRTLTTDAEFADAEKTVKWCSDVEDRLAAAKQHALSQTESIDLLFRTIDDISAEARRVRLELDKLVKARKEELRGEIVAGGIAALREHIATLNARLGKHYMPAIAADFAGAIKGKRTVDSLRDAVSTTLANAKIEASAVADRIQLNMTTLRELASGHAFLFADAAQIVLKAPEDLTMLVKSRIADHKASEEKKEAETRERIRAEEQAKAEKAAREQVEHEQREAEAKIKLEERLATSQQREDARQAEIAGAVLAVRANAESHGGQDEFDNWRQGGSAAPVANVVPMRHAQPATPPTPPTLTLGAIGTRLGFNLSADFLKGLGFEATKVKAACLYHEESFPRICAALIQHIDKARQPLAA